MSYQLTGEGYVIRDDGAKVPITNHPDFPNTNPDYLAYLEWLAQGNTPDPAPLAPLAERQDAVWERIKAERERRRQSGVLVDWHWFHSNDTSRIQQIGLVMMGANIPPGLMWRAMDNGEVPMTQALAGAIFQAVASSDAMHFAVAKAHRAAMEAAPDPDAYDITTGWPAIFEG